MVPNWFLDHLQLFLVKSFYDQVPNKGFAWLATGNFATSPQEFGLGVPSLIAADKPCPWLQHSLVSKNQVWNHQEESSSSNLTFQKSSADQ